MKYESLVKRIGESIVAGRIQEARLELQALQAPRIGKLETRLELARLFRRVGLFRKALVCLAGEFKSRNRRQLAENEPQLVAEYSGSLIKVGAIEEARELLGWIPEGATPERELQMAFALFPNWEYEASLPVLRTYIASPKLTEYQKLIGQTNLAAALVASESYVESAREIQSAIEVASRLNARLLAAGLSEIRAQHLLFTGKYQECREALDEAARVFGGSATREEFYVRKWRVLCDLEEKGYAESRQSIDELIAESRELFQWETLRQIDRMVTRKSFDQSRFLRLYFGSPMPVYRQKILDQNSKSAHELPSEFEFSYSGHFKPGQSASAGPSYLWDVESAIFYSRGKDVENSSRTATEALKSGMVLHRAFAALAEDIYRPKVLGSLHRKIFVDQYFNPLTAPNQLHQILLRLRRWLKQNKIPVTVVEKAGFYSFEAECDLHFIYHRDRAHRVISKKSWQSLEALKSKGFTKDFTCLAAARALKVSRRTMLRHLTEAEESGHLLRERDIAGDKYTFEN